MEPSQSLPDKTPPLSSPIDRRRVDPDAEPLEVEEADVEEDEAEESSSRRPLDPALLWLIVAATTLLGLGSLAPDVRYTALWTTLIVIAILAILFDNLEVEIPTATDMAWGVGYGLLLGVPLVIIALPQLQRTSLTIFQNTSDSFVFQSLALVMPAGESLFFRGAMQPTRGLLFTALAASAWSMLLFFPQLHVLEFPLVAVVIGFTFVVLSFVYSFLKRRFGLFASWTCQITVNLLALFAVRYL